MRHHIVIAGTGRAGTSFLVQYFHLCGADTHIGRHGMRGWDPDANAGLESLAAEGENLPYVVKSGWFHEFVNQLIENPSIKLDAVIVPTRDLVEAASSRVINEQRARIKSQVDSDNSVLRERWGTTPGGVVYSLNPLDQARILAVSFHMAIQSLVRHEIPIVFLDFPRFILDPEYLYRNLRQYLPSMCDADRAYRAHAELADESKVRTGQEISRNPDTTTQDREDPIADPSVEYPSVDMLSKVAARRELNKAYTREGRVSELVFARIRRLILSIKRRIV